MDSCRPRRRATRAGRRVLSAALAAAVLLGGACSDESSSPDEPTSDDAASPSGSDPVRSIVFEGGEAGIDTFRIPGAVTTTAGTVVVLAEARPLSPLDHDPRYLVARRSEDGGATWGPVIDVARPSTDECTQHDPVPTALSSGDIVLVYKNCGELSLSRSTDDGRSWSPPVSLPVDPSIDPAPDLENFRPGPGHGIQLRDEGAEGWLVVAADRNVGEASELVLLLSDDEGTTWRIGARYTTVEGDPDIDETALAELDDGSLLVSSRNGSGEVPGRVELVSGDHGESFAALAESSAVRIAGDLTLPVVEGALLSLPESGRLVFSSPSDEAYRRGVRLWSGTGDGIWSSGPLAVPGPGAYSDLVPLGDPITTVGLVIETGERHPYQRIEFIGVPVADLGPTGEPLPTDYDVAGAAAGRLLIDGERFEILSYCLGAARVELDGGWIEPDLSGGFETVGFVAHVDDRGDGTPLDLDGTASLDLTAGISYRGPVPDTDGTPHDVDLVIVNMEPCPSDPPAEDS